MEQIKVNCIAVFSEHCYVQHPFMEITDNSHEVWTKLTSRLKSLGINIYWNHFALECISGDAIYYLGYNDNVLSIGMTLGRLRDSKEVIRYDSKSPQQILFRIK